MYKRPVWVCICLYKVCCVFCLNAQILNASIYKLEEQHVYVSALNRHEQKIMDAKFET